VGVWWVADELQWDGSLLMASLEARLSYVRIFFFSFPSPQHHPPRKLPKEESRDRRLLVLYCSLRSLELAKVAVAITTVRNSDINIDTTGILNLVACSRRSWSTLCNGFHTYILYQFSPPAVALRIPGFEMTGARAAELLLGNATFDISKIFGSGGVKSFRFLSVLSQ
jgi:hypothetical protein